MFPVWMVMALVFSGMGVAIIGYNQWAKLDGRVMNVWRLGGVLAVALASKPFLPWPVEPSYYMVAAVLGVLLAYADVILADAAKTHGARLVALYVPMKMVMAFVFWLVIMPASAEPLLAEPWRLGLIGVAFALCGWAIAHIRTCDVSWPALWSVLPVALLFAACDGGAKMLLGAQSGGMLGIVGGAVAFLVTTCTVAALFGGGWLMLARQPLPCDRRTIMAGMGFGVLLLVGIGWLLVTLALAPNPGYVGAITMLSSVWLAVWARFHHHEHNNLWAGLLLVLGALGVVVAGN